MYCTYGLAELVFNFYLYCSNINYYFQNNTSNKKEKRLASLTLYLTLPTAKNGKFLLQPSLPTIDRSYTMSTSVGITPSYQITQEKNK